jgi:hypothetical protein
MIQVESSCSVDDSIEVVRKFLVKSQNELMSDKLSKRINKHMKAIEQSIKKGNATESERETFTMLKEIGIE